MSKSTIVVRVELVQAWEIALMEKFLAGDEVRLPNVWTSIKTGMEFELVWASAGDEVVVSAISTGWKAFQPACGAGCCPALHGPWARKA